jgi:hypothetical protein
MVLALVKDDPKISIALALTRAMTRKPGCRSISSTLVVSTNE